ncbi:putative bifunctional diguanylate cyclase/phosphodiesterase [Massilia sp. S19_KUP03_FR1]|uniref:putative bifunctional diguanylate cyclase/phosphodiesterase n=1 Tax=Massilia sp. S19_KUP03_FR1 TaxID=3025503 RepID=UPI002FCD9691
MAPLDNIAHWRTQIFSSLVSFIVAMAFVTAIPSMAMLANEGRWPMFFVDAAALCWLVGLWYFKHAAYRTRVLNFLAIPVLVGTGMMMYAGPVSQIYLVAAPLLAAVLLGTGPAIIALAGTTILVFILAISGYARLPDHALLPSLTISLNYLFIGAVITMSSAIMLQRLAKSLEDLRAVATSLQEGQDALHAVNAELRLTAAAVARLNDMVIISKVMPGDLANQQIIFVNEAFERRTGYQRPEVIGRGWHLMLGADTDVAEVARIGEAVARMEAVSAELLYYTKDHDPYWIEMEMVPFNDEHGTNTHWVMVGRDITERKKSEKHIHRLAFFDVLTGLPNRRLLMERIERLLAHAREQAGHGALLFIDLDHFKYINDARGHGVGDALLRNIAGRLAALVRKGDTVARVGGDEFVVLLAHLGDDARLATHSALLVAEKIRRAITESVEVDNQFYDTSASIGVTLLSHPNQSAHDLLREADTAMYRAKADGRNRVSFFEATMQAEVERRLTLERDLAAALDNGELSMHWQLQVDARGLPVGAELLMRWQRPNGTFVPPDVFIPVAEECGLIVSLGQWALRQACLGFLELRQAGFAMPLSVNVSPSQFRQTDFVAQVRTILGETGAPASELIFEVTEGLLIENLDDTIGRMHELAALGIRLSIDDFGTGYSSLSYLKRMPLYELKIDKSFIRDTPCDANGTAIVQSILAMASHLGLSVVAEGVETREQADFLAANGAPRMQGYLFARPMPLEQMVARLCATGPLQVTGMPETFPG